MFKRILGLCAVMVLVASASSVWAVTLEEMEASLEKLVSQSKTLDQQITTLKSDIAKEVVRQKTPAKLVLKNSNDVKEFLASSAFSSNAGGGIYATFTAEAENKLVTITNFPITINKLNEGGLQVSKIDLYRDDKLVSTTNVTKDQNSSIMKFDLPLTYQTGDNYAHGISPGNRVVYKVKIYFTGSIKSDKATVRVHLSNAEYYKKLTAVTEKESTGPATVSGSPAVDLVIKNDIKPIPLITLVLDPKDVYEGNGAKVLGQKTLTISRGESDFGVSYWNVSFSCPAGLTIETAGKKNLCGTTVKFQNISKSVNTGNIVLISGLLAKNSKIITKSETASLVSIKLEAFNSKKVSLGSQTKTLEVPALPMKTPTIHPVSDRGEVIRGTVGSEMLIYGQDFAKDMAVLFKSSDSSLARGTARIMTSRKASVLVPESVRSGKVEMSLANTGTDFGNIISATISPKFGTIYQGSTSGIYPEFVIVNKSITKQNSPVDVNNVSTTTATANFDIKIKAVGGDITIAGPRGINGVSSFSFGTYLNSVLSIMNSASTTSYDYPSSSDITISSSGATFTIKSGKEVIVPVRFDVEARNVSGNLTNGSLSIGVHGISWSKDSGATWQIVNGMAGNSEWKTPNTVIAKESKTNFMASVSSAVSGLGQLIANTLGW